MELFDSYFESNRGTYKALIYRVESDACIDEFGLLDKEVIDKIQELRDIFVITK